MKTKKFNMARDVFYAFESNIDSQYVLDETEIGTLFALTLSKAKFKLYKNIPIGMLSGSVRENTFIC